jgi:hypothetical protein
MALTFCRLISYDGHGMHLPHCVLSSWVPFLSYPFPIDLTDVELSRTMMMMMMMPGARNFGMDGDGVALQL